MHRHPPLFAQDPPHPSILLLLFIPQLGRQRLRSRREHARPTPPLQIRKPLVRPLGLQHHRTVPAGIDEETVRVGNRDAEMARARIARPSRPNRKRRPVHPSHHIVHRTVRAVICVSTLPTHTQHDLRLSSSPILQQLQVRCNLASPWAYVNIHNRIAMGIVRSRSTNANDPMEVRRRERQAVEVGRHFTDPGVPIVQILKGYMSEGRRSRPHSDRQHTTR